MNCFKFSYVHSSCHVVSCQKCEKGFAVTVFAVLKPVDGSKQNATIYLITMSNSITAFEVGMMADQRMSMVVSFLSQKRDHMR